MFTGVLQKDAEIARGSPVGVKNLFELFQQLMQLHSAASPNAEDLRWKIKIEINQDGACTKYHDDSVEVRFAMTLCGDGTVLADNSQVNWNFYEECNGIIPALQENPDASAAVAQGLIETWNQQICKNQIETVPGARQISGRQWVDMEMPTTLHQTDGTKDHQMFSIQIMSIFGDQSVGARTICHIVSPGKGRVCNIYIYNGYSHLVCEAHTGQTLCRLVVPFRLQ